MTAQERMKRKRRRQMRRRLGLLLPIAAVVLLIAGLTAGGIILSLQQTKKQAPEDETAAARNSGRLTQQEMDTAAPADTEQEQGGAESTAVSEQETEDAGLPREERTETEEETKEQTLTFAAVCKAFTEAVEADPTALSVDNPDFETARQQLLKADISDLTQEEQELYEILTDHMEIEEEGFAFRNNESLSGQRLCDVEGGAEYYRYLLRKLSGTDLTPEEIHEIAAAELNSNYAVMSSLASVDITLPQASQAILKNQAASAYLYQTVTASSDPLKLAIAPEGLRNGWNEFGLIRAYQLDDTLSQNMKEYAIAATRMSYAMYGLLDVSVHFGGWDQAKVTETLNTYYGGWQAAFAARTFEHILE